VAFCRINWLTHRQEKKGHSTVRSHGSAPFWRAACVVQATKAGCGQPPA
jgi:hypothetical protein